MALLKTRGPLLGAVQCFLDVTVLLCVTYFISSRHFPEDVVRVLAIYGSLLLVVVFVMFKMYKSWRGSYFSHQIKKLVLAWTTVLFLFNLIVFLLVSRELQIALWPFVLFRSKHFLFWSFYIFMGFLALRFVVKLLLVLVREKGYNQRHAIIVGSGEAGKRAALYLTENKWMGIRISGFFSDNIHDFPAVRVSDTESIPILGSVEECQNYSLEKNIDIVIIALPMSAEKEINRLLWSLGTSGKEVLMLPDLFAMGIQKSRVHNLGELHLMDFNVFPFWKRAFDICFSLFALLLTFPVWLVIMILIKLEDKGPVFYRQTRIMESGKKFDCLKFRTMHIDADEKLQDLLDENPTLRIEWESNHKLKNDPRITGIGKFLRKTSLDELPQFVNVLIGEMSVVGARPIVSEELHKYYNKTALTYCATKPGITGPWQCGKRSDIEDYNERVQLDNFYVLNCSFWLDVRIILKTLRGMLNGKGAY